MLAFLVEPLPGVQLCILCQIFHPSDATIPLLSVKATSSIFFRPLAKK